MTARKARRLPVQLGPAAWAEILGPGPVPSPLEGPHTADFAVIGAGFAGLSAARRLRQLAPDANIAVLDAGCVAQGAAGRNSGFMIDLPHELTSEDYAGAGDDKAITAMNRSAIAFARQAVGEYEIDPAFFQPVGKVNGAAAPSAHAKNDSYAKHLAALGEACEMLDAAQMKALTGSGHYVSGLYTPGTVMLQPAGYIRGLAAGLQKQGVRIYEQSPVTSFQRQGSAWKLETPGGSVSAGRIILAVNGHLESFGIERGRLMQLFLYGAMTRELDRDELHRLGGQESWGITPSDPMGTSMRRIGPGQGGNRILVRTCAAVLPDMRPGRAGMARAAKVMRRKFSQRFPQLGKIPMQYEWAGHLCLSLNGVSVMREVDDNVFSACVQNGLGTARGTLTGIGAAELAFGTRSDITAHFGAHDRPRKLPPRPFQDIGANTVLRWREWQARKD